MITSFFAFRFLTLLSSSVFDTTCIQNKASLVSDTYDYNSNSHISKFHPYYILVPLNQVSDQRIYETKDHI